MANDMSKYPEGVHDLSALLHGRKISSQELTRHYIDRIDGLDKKIGSFITFRPELAIEEAEVADRRIAKGDDLMPLTGIPIALKDIFVTKGVRTTCGSRILENYIPPYDGTAVALLKKAGSVLLGKLNMDEFAMGSSNEFSAFGPVRNPWDLKCSPGGSSGGSAAAIAAGLTPASLGTDTGGSVRQPASYCGIVAMKPTYGRVSRYGIIAFASSLDQVGPMARDVRDCAIMLRAVAGHDPKDSTSIQAPVPDYCSSLNGRIEGMTIGIPREYFVSGLDAEVGSAVRAAAKKFEELGARVVDISLPHTKYAVPCYYIIAPAEASSNLARYDGIRFGMSSNEPELSELYRATRTKGFGPEVMLRIIVGTYVLSSGYYDAYYSKAQRVRTLIKNDFLNAFKKCDAILTPAAPTPAFRIGEKTNDPIKMYLNDIFTIPVNLAGLPALAMPCGFSGAGLPIGLQLIGKPLGEAAILNIGYAYEQATDWHRRRPVIFGNDTMKVIEVGVGI